MNTYISLFHNSRHLALFKEELSSVMVGREVDMVSIVAHTIGEEDITMVSEAVAVICRDGLCIS